MRAVQPGLDGTRVRRPISLIVLRTDGPRISKQGEGFFESEDDWKLQKGNGYLSERYSCNMSRMEVTT